MREAREKTRTPMHTEGNEGRCRAQEKWNGAKKELCAKASWIQEKKHSVKGKRRKNSKKKSRRQGTEQYEKVSDGAGRIRGERKKEKSSPLCGEPGTANGDTVRSKQ